ncbi:MAG TPA: hypothetical protein DEQ14_05840 [Treponema sp.]|nr:hypothetical protein [Treponema sp.]
MVQTLFFLRFKSQLLRTRPELIRRLEQAVAGAFRDAGGKSNGGRFCQAAVYDGWSPGFWLDTLILIETIQSVLDREKSDLYGYALLVGEDFQENAEALCRFLASGPQEGGVFLDQTAQTALRPYLEFEMAEAWPDGAAEMQRDKWKAAADNLVRVKSFRPAPSQTELIFPLREMIVKAIGQGGRRNSLITGPAFSGKRDGVYRYCQEKMGDFPPLLAHFGTGGINPLVEAWSAVIRVAVTESLGEDHAGLEEIDSLSGFLGKERLRDELSPFIAEKGRRFFSLLLDLYARAAARKGAAPILVLENIHLAGKDTARLIVDLYTTRKNRQEILILGTCAACRDDTVVKCWETIFPRLIKLKAENAPFQPSQVPRELWEIAYTLSLFSRCFPAYLFPQLLEEEGKNPQVIARAFSLLRAYGVIDTPLDPRPRIPSFTARAEAVLGEKTGIVRAMARRRLLSWVERKKLTPCFRLLTLLWELNGSESFADELILKAVYSDLVAGTVRQIEQARKSGAFTAMLTGEKAAVIGYMYETMKALLTGGKNDIRAAFANPAPECSAFPVLKAQILTNLACASLGQRDIKPAIESVKEAIQLSQKKNGFCLAQSYRIFSLVNLSRKQADETNNYLDFAMENAEKSGNYHELGISAYYAAVSQFLSGNVSKAIRLAGKAREEALAAGYPEWADKAFFLEGRLSFETGEYREAYEIFDTLWKSPRGGMSREKDSLLQAWIYRARVYFQNPLTPKPAAGGSDADLFELEASYLAGNFQKTVEIANTLTNPYAQENFLFTEQPDWRSGFAQCELLYFSRGEIWDRLTCAYHALALSRAAEGEKALRTLQSILRDEQLSELDPWASFYFYAWYRVLEQTGAGQVDMNTAVSMAFKRLQRRASRIDDVETKRRYLNRPRWNSALGIAAKEFRLI